MSCGRLALEKAGLSVENYYSSEIESAPIKVASRNFPKNHHLGDVTKIHVTNMGIEVDQPGHSMRIINERIDLLIGGSPCQGFSFAGKQLNFEDPRSKLFFEFVRIYKALREKNPNLKFMLENVKMKKEYQDVITSELGVAPIEINSELVSAQRRKRLYWTNIPNITQPSDRGIFLKDIVHETEFMAVLKNHGQYREKADKSNCFCANYFKGQDNSGQRTCIVEWLNKYKVPFDRTLQILDKEVQRGKIGYFRKDSQANRVYYIHDKAVTLCGDSGGGAAKMGQYLFGTITPDRIEKRQNGQRFSDGIKFYTLTAQDRHGILIEGYIRKLTPIECERLQTVPDGYTDGVSDTQRYKMLGNGWTVDVIAHIFKGLKTA